MYKKEKRSYLILIIAVVFISVTLTACDSSDYNQAIALFDSGNYESAKIIFEALGDYENSSEYVKDCDYHMAKDEYNNGNYKSAIAIYESLGEYKDSSEQITICTYSIGVELFETGSYVEALEVFEGLSGYDDSEEFGERCIYYIEKEALFTELNSEFEKYAWKNVFYKALAFVDTYAGCEEADVASTYMLTAANELLKGVYKDLAKGQIRLAYNTLIDIAPYNDEAKELLPEVEKYREMAGKYMSKGYYRGGVAKNNPYKETYTLEVVPIYTDGNWKVQYSIQLPGIYNIISSNCFVYKCTSESIDSDVYIYNPNIDRENADHIRYDELTIKKTRTGYFAEHRIYYKSGGDIDFTFYFSR